MKTKTKKVAKDITGNYTASIKIMGKIYTSVASSIIEAIGALQVGRVNRGVSVLTIGHNGNSQSKILPSVQTMRLFSPSPTTREIALKNVSLRFYAI